MVRASAEAASGRVTRRLDIVRETCAERCFGQEGNAGCCCKVADRDFIIGPVLDVDRVVAALSRLFRRTVLRAEVVVEFAEGCALFPERSHWQNRANYPAMRVRLDAAEHACVFYDGGCTIYEQRPEACRRFVCEALQEQLIQNGD